MEDFIPFINISPALEAFLTIAFGQLMALVSPGPDFAMVVKNSVTRSRRAGFFTSMGIASGASIHSAYCIIGLGVLLTTFPIALQVIKGLGAAYLCFLGVRAMASKPHAAQAEGGHKQTDLTFREAYLQGLSTTLLNPNAIIYYISLISALVTEGASLPFQWFCVFWFGFTAACWFSFVAFSLTTRRAQKSFGKYAHWVERATGAVLVLVATLLIYQIWI